MKNMDIKQEEDNQNRIFLEETFYVLSKKNCVFRVRLTKEGICLIKETDNTTKEQLIPIRDIIGCRCFRSKRQTHGCACQNLPRSNSLQVVEDTSGELDDSDLSAYLYIYAYIFQGNRDSNRKRERTIITLRFRSFDKYEENNKEAQRWRTILKRLMKGEEVTIANIVDFSLNHRFKETQKLLVLCNPKSGPGKGKYIFQQKIAPILQEAEIQYDLKITQHANFAREFVRTSRLFQWAGIILVGGDGIVFEVINGIFERSDWAEVVKKVPLCIVPGGSGNGLARSIAYHCDEPYLQNTTLPSALSAVRRNTASMDLVRVETTSQIMFSFLSVGWGLLSDIDIESERLRILGGQRFTVWSLARLIGLRTYNGKLWYLPSNVPMIQPREPLSNIGSCSSNLDIPSEVHLETDPSRPRVDSWYSANSKRSAYFSATGSSYQSTADSGNGDNKLEDGKLRMYGPGSQLPCLTAELPKTWKCISGKFIMVHASYQTHLAEDCLFAPDATLNDGKIWLLIVRGEATRSQVLQFLLGLSSGAHASIQSEGGPIELIPVHAFRIEPDMNELGYITVDGEHVEYGPIQAEIFPELGRVMVP